MTSTTNPVSLWPQTVYPWQQSVWDRLQPRISEQHLAHGLLLTAPAGSGLEEFAYCLAARLLDVENHARGRALLDAGSHPDVMILAPEEEGKAVKIDAIRELLEFVSLKAQYGSRKVAIILNAEAMNRNAANSLLKTLEEPPPQSILLLVSSQPGLLPITIRSRCQIIDLTPVAQLQIADWLRARIDDSSADVALLLAIAGQAPLAASELVAENGLSLRDQLLDDLAALKAMRTDAVTAAEQWNQRGVLAVHDWLYRLTRDLVRCRVLGVEAVVNRDQSQRLASLTTGLSLRQVINYHDLVIKNYRLLTGPTNPNSTVLLEDFILHWQGIVEA